MDVEVTSGVYFQNLYGRTVGLCFYNLNRVLIDIDSYIKFSEIERKALIYHELGHCMCDLDHDETQGEFCPESLMYPTTSIRLCYEINWNKYVKDLRMKCQK